MSYFLINLMVFFLGLCVYLALPVTNSHGNRVLTTILIVSIVVLLKVLYDVPEA